MNDHSPASPTLDKVPVTALKGVGKSLTDKLAKLGLHNLQDLLFHLPLRYLDRTRITPIGALQPGVTAVLEGEIKAADVVFGRRRSLVVKLQDATGTLTLRFFHFNQAQKQNLARGLTLRCFGEARRGAAGLELYHPEYEAVTQASPALAQSLTPVYPATEGVTQPRMRSLVQQTLAFLTPSSLRELLPTALRQAHGQLPLADALRYLHQPPTDADVQQLALGQHPAQQRLAFEELLAHHLSLLGLRQQLQAEGAPALPHNRERLTAFLQQLPFNPTKAQSRVAQEIAADLAQPVPMLRLVQGDVGSGKTLVAAMAALQAIGNGYQVALMAPTEILSEQHRHNFQQWFEPLGIQVGWLAGKQKVAERRDQLSALASGQTQLIVGTHALFQEQVNFADLGLVIIDEQHRFGVHQRLSLREKAGSQLRPHQLIMTATPIPRTLAMSAYADLDCSVIDELPPGRKPVTTVVINQDRRDLVIERVRAAIGDGRQVYWVCTLIEESETLTAQAAEATQEALALSLPGVAIGLVHGRLKPSEKESVMAQFKAGQLPLLVATTVIEVGVDVPNASLMIIDNPERLGLAQLHQLRGRVGRGSAESHCVLLYSGPLSQHSKARLEAMRATNDGFVIAEKDLELRGPGEVLGTRQTGAMNFKIADLQRDAELIPQVRTAATDLLANHPQQTAELTRRWLGYNEVYAKV
ncbi:ATP-dependent DNA helicase RecG [Simiduia aestuariiviva]|uniref:ATP-dependent DNA helicase RecG n=1 Tax=Simiduia aestuariiviva TaxID=1510459 RepID=A0A839UWX3_9GAMM|nr:ATP-dependent DNA helicase RecG [Simiduia aestuariiviva]MBB3169867.1 ATP-dependent DNA helicase RecG [Simiduia aestuariiviva]